LGGGSFAFLSLFAFVFFVVVGSIRILPMNGDVVTRFFPLSNAYCERQWRLPGKFPPKGKGMKTTREQKKKKSNNKKCYDREATEILPAGRLLLFLRKSFLSNQRVPYHTQNQCPKPEDLTLLG
jgi:hypothetical protein